MGGHSQSTGSTSDMALLLGNVVPFPPPPPMSLSQGHLLQEASQVPRNHLGLMFEMMSLRRIFSGSLPQGLGSGLTRQEVQATRTRMFVNHSCGMVGHFPWLGVPPCIPRMGSSGID